MDMQDNHKRILTCKEVCAMLGKSRSTIYAWVEQGKFPRQVKLSGRSVAWLKDEVEAWLQGKIEARDATLKEAA